MITNTIKTSDIFRDLNPSELQLVQNKAIKTVYLKDEVIFQEGDASDQMYMVVQGVVEIWKSEGKTLKGSRLARLQEGEIFGEMALFDHKPRSATAVAAIETETVILVWSQKEFNSLISENPQIGIKVLKNIIDKISGRLRNANDAIHTLLRSNQYISL